jgi:hypothetical protein
MKRFLAVAAVALIAVAVYATVAPAGPQAVTPRQFSALSKKVTKLQKDFNSLKNVVGACVLTSAVPVAQFGNPEGSEGYDYVNTDNSEELQTALDVSASSVAQGWFLNTTAECANAINSGKAKKLLARLRAHVK